LDYGVILTGPFLKCYSMLSAV